MLNTGKIQKDIDVFNKVELKEFPVNMRNYFKIRYDLIKVELLIHEGNLKKAEEKLEEIKRISNFIEFKYIYNSALELESLVKGVINSH